MLQDVNLELNDLNILMLKPIMFISPICNQTSKYFTCAVYIEAKTVGKIRFIVRIIHCPRKLSFQKISQKDFGLQKIRSKIISISNIFS